MRRRYIIDLALARAKPSPSAINSVATARDIAAPVRQPAKKKYVAFDKVPPSHWAIHDRLLNWARASRGGDKQSGQAAPMFTLYRSGDAKREYGAETEVPVDRSDAVVVGRAVGFLPDKNRRALHWHYVFNGRDPVGQARDLGVTLEGLAGLVNDARQTLINREV